MRGWNVYIQRIKMPPRREEKGYRIGWEVLSWGFCLIGLGQLLASLVIHLLEYTQTHTQNLTS